MAVYLINLRKVHHHYIQTCEINHDHPMIFHQRVVGLLVVNEQQTRKSIQGTSITIRKNTQSASTAVI